MAETLTVLGSSIELGVDEVEAFVDDPRVRKTLRKATAKYISIVLDVVVILRMHLMALSVRVDFYVTLPKGTDPFAVEGLLVQDHA